MSNLQVLTRLGSRRVQVNVLKFLHFGESFWPGSGSSASEDSSSPRFGSPKSRDFDTLPLHLRRCLGVRGWKLDTYGIYINDLWKNILFLEKFIFSYEKSWNKTYFFEKSRNPQNSKILKSQNFRIFRKSYFFDSRFFIRKNKNFERKNIFS